MAEREAHVIETVPASQTGVPAYVRLEFEISGGCGRCHEAGGCGGVSLAQPLCAKPKILIAPDTIGLQVGDRVLVSIPDAMLAQGITRAYLLPLLLFFAGSGLGAMLLPIVAPMQWQLTPDVGAIAGAGFGLIAAWFQLQRSQRGQPMGAPRIVERLYS